MAKQLKGTLVIAIAALALVNVIALYKPVWQPFEKKIYDLKYQIMLRSEPQESIVIIDIDEASLAKLGRYQNWPRAYFAEVIDYLKPAAAVGIDIFFAEPDTLPVIARQYYQKPDFDSMTGSAIRSSGNVTLISTLEQEPVFAGLCSTGLGEIIADNDGVVRRGYFALNGKKTFAAVLAGITKETKAGSFLIIYHSLGSFRFISFVDVYLKRVPQEYFAGKTILIGGSAPGLFDYHATPFARHFPGIAIQANLVLNMRSGDRIHEVPYGFVLLFTLVAVLIIVFLVIRAKYYLYISAIVVIVLLTIILSLVLFTSKMDAGVVRLFYTFVAAVIGALIYRYQVEEKEKKKIKSIFARYYSKELVEKVIAKPPKLGGEKVECTILFADIRNFTPYAEKSSPEEVGAKLNRFLTEMVIIVFKYQGRIDKFIGDCVMAVFGSPVQVKNSAFNACQAAREMVKRAKELGFSIGAGINTGEVISGNFGSPMRMEYTVIGDAVNLAARLESLTKEFGVQIIVSETTSAMAKKNEMVELPFRALGKARVKGKADEISVYELQ
ncbi:MAG TPA: adenylate/guanylate cyclase domain-containing protein [bacterium]